MPAVDAVTMAHFVRSRCDGGADEGGDGGGEVAMRRREKRVSDLSGGRALPCKKKGSPRLCDTPSRPDQTTGSRGFIAYLRSFSGRKEGRGRHARGDEENRGDVIETTMVDSSHFSEEVLSRAETAKKYIEHLYRSQRENLNERNERRAQLETGRFRVRS